jgi:TatD DNase family protein
MQLVDSHSHLYLPEFDFDRPIIIEQAEKQGVAKILLPAIDATTHTQMLKLEQEYPSIFFSMMGLHPCSVNENYKDELKIVRNYLDKRTFKAIGEIGLDFYWDKTFTEQQLFIQGILLKNVLKWLANIKKENSKVFFIVFRGI